MNFWERNGNEYDSYNGKDFNAEKTDWQSKIGEYASKTQDEMMQELLSTANRMKSDGTLNAQTLDDFYMRVSVFLNDEQKHRMRALIEMLKK